MEIREQVPLAPLTTFEIGGKARYFAEARSVDELQEAITWARKKNVTFRVLAGGSNVLIKDSGIDGLVIHIANADFRIEGQIVLADAGCNLLTLIHEASARGLGGWEKLAGIPGTIGGAVRGNAGAFGPEIKDFVTRVHALNAATDETREFENVDCDFSYRQSFFKKHSEWIVTRVLVELEAVDAKDSVALIERTVAERERRHIQNVRAAGSFFMNPVVPRKVQEMFERERGVPARLGRVPAGWLIEKAGLKGAQVGGVQASLQHPNYLVNTGNATAANVLELASRIKEEVLLRFDVQLEEEAALFT